MAEGLERGSQPMRPSDPRENIAGPSRQSPGDSYPGQSPSPIDQQVVLAQQGPRVESHIGAGTLESRTAEDLGGRARRISKVRSLVVTIVMVSAAIAVVVEGRDWFA